MKIVVLGGCGAWPAAGQACSGYLVEHDGFQLLVDPGYATLPRLLEEAQAELVDAVVISHGHPDQCADLNPLLRARHLGEIASVPLPVYALAGAVNPVLGLDRPGMLPTAASPSTPSTAGPASCSGPARNSTEDARIAFQYLEEHPWRAVRLRWTEKGWVLPD
jgi:ribonuclease BN (tRNA processing enzyme)